MAKLCNTLHLNHLYPCCALVQCAHFSVYPYTGSGFCTSCEGDCTLYILD